MEARGFEQIDRAERIHFKIENGNVPRFVVGGLRSAMNDEIEAVGAEQSFHADAVANVQLMVSEVPRDAAQAFQIPGRVTGIAEKDPAHVVVHAMDCIVLTVKVFDGFRANQPAGTCNQNCLQGHVRYFKLLAEVRNSGTLINFPQFDPGLPKNRSLHRPASFRGNITGAELGFVFANPIENADKPVAQVGFRLPVQLLCGFAVIGPIKYDVPPGAPYLKQ